MIKSLPIHFVFSEVIVAVKELAVRTPPIPQLLLARGAIDCDKVMPFSTRGRSTKTRRFVFAEAKNTMTKKTACTGPALPPLRREYGDTTVRRHGPSRPATQVTADPR